MRTERPILEAERRLSGARVLDEEASEGTPDGEESDTSLSRWLPEATSGKAAGWLATVRADPGRAGVVGLGIVGAVAVLVTVFTLTRDDGPAITSAKLPPVQMVSSTAPVAPVTGEVTVSVVGLVHQPGLVTLGAGARIADALSAAGGPLDGADLVGLNMARRVGDGEQIVVGLSSPLGAPPAMGSSITSPTGAAPSPPVDEKGSASGELVDLNTATVEQLDTLPRVGPATAQRIVDWREANGPFASVDSLLDIPGIGEKTLAGFRDRLTV